MTALDLTTPASYEFGPANAQLTVRTGRTGVAARAGHNLLIEARDWQATLAVGAQGQGSSLTVRVSTSALEVLEGTGGIQELDDDDKRSIAKTINEEILKGAIVEFRSSRVELGQEGLSAEGELELMGQRRPLRFTLLFDGDGRLAGRTRFKQSDWGITPYATLFGTLKVADEVEVAVEAQLNSRQGEDGDG